MKRLIRTLLFGAATAWLANQVSRKRQEWSTKPAAEIRRNVTDRLPDSVDAATKEKIADGVVKAVKGNEPVVVEPSPPPAQDVTSPPAPETPDRQHGE